MSSTPPSENRVGQRSRLGLETIPQAKAPPPDVLPPTVNQAVEDDDDELTLPDYVFTANTQTVDALAAGDKPTARAIAQLGKAQPKATDAVAVEDVAVEGLLITPRQRSIPRVRLAQRDSGCARVRQRMDICARRTSKAVSHLGKL